MDGIKVLVVEDEFVTGCEIQARLTDLGYDVPIVVDTGAYAIEAVAKYHPRVVIMDITLKGEMTGIEAAQRIREKFGIPVIYLTAHSDDATVEKAVITEPFGYLIKPLEERALQTAIRMALYKYSLDLSLRESEKKYREIAELAEDSIIIINQDYSVEFLNEYGVRYFHRSPGDIKGKELNKIIPASLSEQIIHLLEAIFILKESQRQTLSTTIAGSQIWLDTTLVPVLSEEDGEVTQVIGLMHDITALIVLEKDMEKKGIRQIEQNMEQFQILNDKIRNPLSIIISAASLEDTENSRIIIEQAKKIDDLVAQLDRGWVESETVRAFLLKHYGHGKDI